MSDRREEILNSEHQKLVDDRGFLREGGDLILVHRPAAISAMDEYMKECCLGLLEYMSNHFVSCVKYGGDAQFWFKGELITKEQLFDNFL